MFAHMLDIVGEAEAAASGGQADAALDVLRRLSLDDFGVLLLEMPHADFPALSAMLPQMADDEVQRNWTGNAGHPLLAQTLNFVRSTALRFQQLTGRPLQGASMLDFGCGYGRILRLMAFFSPPARIWGVDPWDRSIELCRQDRILANLAISDYLPQTLPVGEARFSLVYAFSVFTHLSERATRLALATLGNYLDKDGLLVITIRPIEYWERAAAALSPGQDKDAAAAQPRLHAQNGFAFVPHGRAPIDGDITYGDTSMTFEWLAAAAPGFDIVGYDHTLDDLLQIIVYLRHKGV